MTFELLEELRHQHGVFAAGNADGDAVAFFDQFILHDGFFKAADEVVLEGLAQGFVHLLPAGEQVFFFTRVYRRTILCRGKVLPVKRQILLHVLPAGILCIHQSISWSVYFSSQ